MSRTQDQVLEKSGYDEVTFLQLGLYQLFVDWWTAQGWGNLILDND